jgi:DNA invertase Pin-like site-specific DNA recombinase
MGYVRVSTDDQADKGLGLDDQREKIRLYCRTYNLILVDILVDAGKSARSIEGRPALKEALAALGQRCEGLVVAKLDRLTRSIADMAHMIDAYFDRFSLLAIQDHLDTKSASGRLVMNMLLSVSQWEREVIAERTRDAMRQKRLRGESCGRPPLGYRRVERKDENGETIAYLEVDEEEQATLERVRELMAQKNPKLSLRDMAKILTAEERKTKGGGRWGASNVSCLVTRLSQAS